MDAKITKSRLNEYLAYDWPKLIALVVAGILLWSLITTMISTRATIGQAYDIFVNYDVTATSRSSSLSAELRKEKALSYDVLTMGCEQLTEQYASTVLQARLSTQSGDMMVLTDNNTSEEEGVNNSSFYNFTAAYSYSLFNVDTYIRNAETYVGRFCEGDTLSNEKIEAHFKDRMKGDKRYNYLYASKMDEGVADEIERITALKAGLDEFKGYFEDGTLTKTYFTAPGAEGETPGEPVPYGINLGKLLSIGTLFRTSSADIQNTLTVLLFDWGNAQYDLQFESVTVINYLVRTYREALA